MSILHIAHNRKHIRRYFVPVMALSLAFMLLMAISFTNTALAGGIGDVVTEVANANFSSPDFEFGSEQMTGLGIKMHTGYGGFGSGYGGVTVLGQTDSAGMQTMLNYVDGEANHTSIHTTRMKGCEVREYTMSGGAGVGVVLPDYFITVELYESGNSNAADIQTALTIAQQTLDGLERAGLLSQDAPNIESAEPVKEETEANSELAPRVTGNPLDEPVAISDTMNIAGVYNGPTTPTIFSINSPHLVTYISTYHWNNAQGATPGTIALQDNNGTVYGPWQVTSRPGQGGVPNAYWEVTPNIVIPAGTYTVIDSDPATWAQNQESEGRGMGEVRATPHFEVTGGSVDDLTNIPGGANTSSAGAYTESPAGVGAAGNIPGPSNTAEAVVGVAVPGLIATGLGALAGLGGGGGFAPPGGTPLSPNAGGPVPGTGGNYPGARTQPAGAAQDINQLGRRRRGEAYVSGPEADPGVIIDTAEMGQGAITVSANVDQLIETADEAAIFVQPESGVIIDTAEEGAVINRPDSDLIIETSREEAGLIQPDSGIIIETGQEAGIFIQPEPGLLIDAADEAGVITSQHSATLIDNSDSGILIDTSALDVSIPAESETVLAGGELGEETVLDSKAEATVIREESIYDQEGYNSEGFDKDGFNKAGFDAEGYDKEGFNQAGFDKEGFNREGFDQSGFDREGFNKEGFDKAGFDREGFNKVGFDAEGYDKEGFNQAGFDKEGFNREGFDQSGFDREGFNKEGFDKAGFDREGYNNAGFDPEGFDREGFNKAGFDKEGFNREGFDQSGYDKEGFNKEGFDITGFDREGYNKAGFDAEGYDREGFNEADFDKEGYGRNGFNSEGFDREGFDVNGYNAKGFNRSGYNAEGYNAAGYDKKGFNEDGWDREGYDRNGLDKNGYDRQGYDKTGYDKDGYDREGYNREGQSKEGYDENGYDQKGFNKNGYDKDGFDREGFNYEGYNRSGYDPWGFDKQGYDKDGYHWSGYNADGYNRAGMHWTDNPYEGDSPFNVSTEGNGVYNRNPFDGGPVIIDQDNYGNKVDLASSWKPTKPPLGEPYPRTAEKYGAKPWTDEIPQPDQEKPTIPPTDNTGIIGPEDPMNTLKHHGIDKDAPAAPEGQDGSGVPVPEEEQHVSSGDIPGDAPVDTGDANTFTYTDPETGQTSTYEYEPGYTGPRHGDSQTLVGKADGQTYELKFDAVKGKWINTESGNEFNPDDFERWQNDLAVDKRRADIDLEKMAQRQDANSKAIDKNLDDWKKLEQMQKAADKYNIGQPGGPGDVDKAIEDLKKDMLAGKELDQVKMDKIRRVIDHRIMGKTTADTGERWEEVPWYQDIGSALKANAAMAKEVVTGEKDDGSTSWLGMAARIMITAATGGTASIAGIGAQVAMDGTLTIAEAMYRIKDSIDKGESDFRAVSKAIGLTILGEEMGWLAGKAGGKIMGEMLERFPVFTNKAADLIETGLLKIMKADQIASRSLGMISKESAEETIKQIEKRLTDLGGDVAEEAMEKAAKGVSRGAAGSADDIAGGAGRTISGSGDDIATGAGKSASNNSDDIARGTGKSNFSGEDDLAKGGGKTPSGKRDDMAKGTGKSASSSSDELARGKGKATSAGTDAHDGAEKTPFGRNDDANTQGTGRSASGSGNEQADGPGKTAIDGDGSKSPDGSDGMGKTATGRPDDPDGPGKPSPSGADDAADTTGKGSGGDDGAVKTGPASSSVAKVNDYYSQSGKQAEIDSYAHINMDMERVRETMHSNNLTAGESGAVYAAPPKAGVPAYEFTNTTTVRISDKNLVDVRLRTGPGGQTQYVTPRGELIDPANLTDKILMTPAPEGTGMILTYYDPQGNIRSYIPAKFLERWSDAVNGFVPMG